MVHIPIPDIPRVLGREMSTGQTVLEALQSIEQRSNGELMASEFVRLAGVGKEQLWVVWDGKIRAIAGTLIETTGHGEAQARVRFCTGEQSEHWRDAVVAEIEAWARAHGCARLLIFARPGWSRLLKGFHVRHVELERSL